MPNTYSPSVDTKIFRKFSVRSLKAKIENKLALQSELGLVVEKKVPLLCIPCSITNEEGGQLFAAVAEGIVSQNCQLLVRGRGSQEHGELCTRLEKDYSHKVRIVKDTDDMLRKMYAAADIGLFFSAQSHQEDLEHCLTYGVVPVSSKRSPLEDYNPAQESGNAFVCEQEQQWSWFAALVRALETFKLPYDWRTIQKQGMSLMKEREE